jgi:MFS family permease
MSLQLPAMLQDVGLSVSRASAFLGLMLGLSVVGRLGIGGLADRFDKRRVLAVAAAGLGFSSLLVLARGSPLGRTSYVMSYGVFVGGTFTTLPLVAQSIFGMRAFGRIYVTVALAVSLGAALGSYLGARVYDWQGSYTGSVLLACGCAVLASLLVLTLRRRDWGAERIAAVQTSLGR